MGKALLQPVDDYRQDKYFYLPALGAWSLGGIEGKALVGGVDEFKGCRIRA